MLVCPYHTKAMQFCTTMVKLFSIFFMWFQNSMSKKDIRINSIFDKRLITETMRKKDKRNNVLF